jgi:hypothetical protein
MIKTEDKIKVCEKYFAYLYIIMSIGNGVILQKQFYEICSKLDIYLNEYQIRKILEELEEFQIIKKQNFLGGKNKVIVLKKFAFRFLFEKDSSAEVSSLPKNIDKRVIASIFKFDRIIKIIDTYKICYWHEFLGKIEELNTSLLYHKYDGVFYHSMLIDKFGLDVSKQDMYHRGVKNREEMLKNLCKGRGGVIYDDIDLDNLDRNINPFLVKYHKMETVTIDTLINSNIYIENIVDLLDTKIVEISIMDIHNSQNPKKIIDGIMLSCIAIREIFKEERIKFKFKVIMWDNVAKENVKSVLAKKDINQDYNFIRSKLINYKIDGRNALLDLRLDINDIRITLTHIDIYNKYIGNVDLISKI